MWIYLITELPVSRLNDLESLILPELCFKMKLCVDAHYFVKLFCVQCHAVLEVAILHLGEVVPLFMAGLFTLPPPNIFAMIICVIF